MSVWYKAYAKTLSNHQIQSCLKKQPTSVLIYYWCLGCCAEEGSDSFPWNGNMADFEGLASLLHIDLLYAQSGMGLLTEAGLVRIANNRICVMGWDEHQSEYLSRKTYFKDRYKSKTSGISRNYTVKHREALLEDKREDQSTGESELPDRDDAQPPRLSRVMKKVAVNGTAKENT